jgi:hypothetical protein
MNMRPKVFWLRLWVLIIIAGCVAGCAGLCTKHLYIFRGVEAKNPPPAQSALLITDPALAAAVSPGRAYPAGGCHWDEEQGVQQFETYRLSLDHVDDKPVYQGRCLDTKPTHSLELPAGRHRVEGRMDLYGSFGQERRRETKELDLAPGAVYFVQPDCRALTEHQFILKVQRLPEPYSPQLRTRVADWNRQHDKSRQLAD